MQVRENNNKKRRVEMNELVRLRMNNAKVREKKSGVKD